MIFQPVLASKQDYYKFLNSHPKFKNNPNFSFFKFQTNVYNLSCFGLSYNEIINDPLILNLDSKDLKNLLKLCLLSNDNIHEFLEYKFLFDVKTIYPRYKKLKNPLINANSIYYHSHQENSSSKVMPITDENILAIRSDFSHAFPEINNNLQLLKFRRSYNNVSLTMDDQIKKFLSEENINDNKKQIIKNLIYIKDQLGVGVDYVQSIVKRNLQLMMLGKDQYNKFYDYLYNDCRISKMKILRILKTRFNEYYTKFYNKQLYEIFYPDQYAYQLNDKNLVSLEDYLKLSFLFNNHNANQFNNTLISNCNPPEKYLARIMANYDGLIPDFALYINDQEFKKATNLTDSYLQKIYPYTSQIKNEVNYLFASRYPKHENQIKLLKLNSLDVSKLTFEKQNHKNIDDEDYINE